jgi:hypothetical protein
MSQLLQHQLKPLEYIIAKCKKQHGLILNHYMGTGKTLTGLVFLKNYPKYKKVIILPSGFDSFWINEARINNIDISDVVFITFNQLVNFENYRDILKNSICIVDEAHNLYGILESLYDKPEYKNIDNTKKKASKKFIDIKPRLPDLLNILYSTKKILLLTGTPVRNQSVSDIRWLINIAAAKKDSIVPFDNKAFYNKFLKINRLDIAWINGIRELLKFNPFEIISPDFVKQMPFKENIFVEFVYKLISANTFTYIYSKIKKPKFFTLKGPFNYTRLVDMWKELINNKKTVTTNLILGTLLYRITSFALKYLKNFYKEKFDFVQLDPDKFIKAKANRYISYFNYNYIVTSDYPKFKEFIKKVDYTPQQLKLMIKVIGIPENLTDSEYVSLELNNNIREAELFRDEYFLKSKYTDKGRIIGNLFKNPIKFLEILAIIRKGEQNVIYSNFYNSGITIFSKFLRANKVKHVIFSDLMSTRQKIKILRQFKEKKIKVLLLHPSFYEGISILGCNALHVLEPIKSLEIREQLYARVIRYHSHHHLPLEERHVVIYQWGVTLENEITKIFQIPQILYQWFSRDDPNLSIFNLVERFKDNLSPDDMLLKRYAVSNNFSKKLSDDFRKISIDNSKIPSKCCIWTPDNSCLAKKLDSCLI